MNFDLDKNKLKGIKSLLKEKVLKIFQHLKTFKMVEFNVQNLQFTLNWGGCRTFKVRLLKKNQIDSDTLVIKNVVSPPYLTARPKLGCHGLCGVMEKIDRKKGTLTFGSQIHYESDSFRQLQRTIFKCKLIKFYFLTVQHSCIL